jgi:hypothetical protein
VNSTRPTLNPRRSNVAGVHGAQHQHTRPAIALESTPTPQLTRDWRPCRLSRSGAGDGQGPDDPVLRLPLIALPGSDDAGSRRSAPSPRLVASLLVLDLGLCC